MLRNARSVKNHAKHVKGKETIAHRVRLVQLCIIIMKTIALISVQKHTFLIKTTFV
jgi:hypothetical protein